MHQIAFLREIGLSFQLSIKTKSYQFVGFAILSAIGQNSGEVRHKYVKYALLLWLLAKNNVILSENISNKF